MAGSSPWNLFEGSIMDFNILDLFKSLFGTKDSGLINKYIYHLGDNYRSWIPELSKIAQGSDWKDFGLSPEFDSEGFNKILSSAKSAPYEDLLGKLAGVASPFPWNMLIGLGTSLFGAWQEDREVDEARDHNLRLAKLQNSWNLQQWHRENAYNHPVNQMNRLNEAGLNPNMMYQNGASGLTATSSPQMTSGDGASPWSIMPLLQMLQQMQLIEAQTRNTEAQTRNTEAQTNKTNVETKQLPIELQADLQRLGMEMKKMDSDLLDAKLDRFFKTEEWRRLSAESMIDREIMRATLKKLMFENNLDDAFKLFERGMSNVLSLEEAMIKLKDILGLNIDIDFGSGNKKGNKKGK